MIRASTNKSPVPKTTSCGPQNMGGLYEGRRELPFSSFGIFINRRFSKRRLWQKNGPPYYSANKKPDVVVPIATLCVLRRQGQLPPPPCPRFPTKTQLQLLPKTQTQPSLPSPSLPFLRKTQTVAMPELQKSPRMIPRTFSYNRMRS